MITNLDPASELFLANLNRTQQSIAQANSQVSSGLRISVASDAPDQIDSLLQLRADELHNNQIQTNLGLAKTDADAADTALSSSIQLMDSALTLGAQGANTALDAAGRQAIAQQVQALQEQMVAYSQTVVQGRYVFSGDQDGSPTYQIDLAVDLVSGLPVSPTGVDQLSNSPATRQIEDPAGGSFQASQTAQAIFDDRDASGNPTSSNVFLALNNLRLALQANDIPGITDCITSVKAASGHLNSMEEFYGNVQNRIQNATNFAASYDVQLKTEISQKQDADVASAALQLTQGNTDLQAALEMQAKMPRTSLFDYMG
jgi:flagellar hook-associated protein 3 FlgL